jgi:hypothetical protein
MVLKLVSSFNLYENFILSILFLNKGQLIKETDDSSYIIVVFGQRTFSIIEWTSKSYVNQDIYIYKSFRIRILYLVLLY